MGVTSIIPMIIYRTESIGIKKHVWNTFALDIIQHSPPPKKKQTPFFRGCIAMSNPDWLIDSSSQFRSLYATGPRCTFIPFKRSLNKRNLIGKRMYSIVYTCYPTSSDSSGSSWNFTTLLPPPKKIIWIASISPAGSEFYLFFFPGVCSNLDP